MKQLFIVFIILLAGIQLMPASAQEDREMYKCKQIGNKYIVSVNNMEDIVEALTAFCKEKEIKSGTITGLGAINEATLRFFNPQTKKYVDKTFNEQMEVTNLTGNVSTMDGKTYLHLHVTLGKSDYTALAGHLLSARLNGAGEFVVEDFGEKVERTYDPAIGLNFYDFEK